MGRTPRASAASIRSSPSATKSRRSRRTFFAASARPSPSAGLRAATDRFTRATSTPPEEPKGLVARRPGERLDVAKHPLALPGLLAQVVAQPGAQVQHLLVARHPEAFLGGPAGLHLRHVRRGS